MTFLVVGICVVVTYLLIAVALIFSQDLTVLAAEGGINFASADTAGTLDVGISSYVARDGVALGVRHYPGRSDNGPLVVVLHGSGWHGGAYTSLGAGLSEQYGLDVVIPDLRGHGPQPVRRGDVDYVGQLEDDVADLIGAYGGDDRPVYVVGHSSGGGLAIRFAGGQYGSMLTKAVLIAPFLKYDAPTARPMNEDGSGGDGWTHVLQRRLIGQIMLNAVGITAFDGMPMIQFRFPESVLSSEQGQTATLHYSFRLNTSFAPRNDYLGDVAKLPTFLLVAGLQDEVFRSQAYEPTLGSVNPQGRYELLPGVDHLGVIAHAHTLTAVGAFLMED